MKLLIKPRMAVWPRRAAAALAFVALLGLGTATAWAQRGVIVLEEDLIELEVETPQAFLVLSPTALEYRFRAPVESFLDALFETVEEAPF